MLKKIISIITLMLLSFFVVGVNNVSAYDLMIESSNVSYDLKLLYGGDNPHTYDINNLLPTDNTDLDTDFKFYCVKPVQENLYLYLYHKDIPTSEIKHAMLNISLSNKQNTDGTFKEDFVNVKARYINSYGYNGRFMKFAIDNIVRIDDSYRFFLQDITITYKRILGSTYDTPKYIINDEAFFSLESNNDFTYYYYKSDYVKITDQSVQLMIVPKDRYYVLGGGTYYSSANEEFYYFFSTDRDISEIVEIIYDYEYITYDSTMQFQNGNADTETGNAYGNGRKKGMVYGGLLAGNNTNLTHQNQPINTSVISSIKKQNNSVKMGSYYQEVQREKFMWWNQTKTYYMENIQNALDTSNLNDDYITFKSMINDVQNQRVKDNKPKFEWAFKVVSDERYVHDAWIEYEWWSFLTGFISGNNSFSVSRCHEVKQAMITYLHFRTEEQDFRLNALDVPIDTSSIIVSYVPFDTLPQLVTKQLKNIFSSIGNTATSLIDNIIPILILVATIMLLIIGWPFISAIFSVVGGTVKHTGNKAIENKKAKDKKRRKRQNE